MMMLALILYVAAIITFARAHHWIPAVLLVVMFGLHPWAWTEWGAM